MWICSRVLPPMYVFSRFTMFHRLTLSFSKTIFLAGITIAYLALAISLIGSDLHGSSGIALRLAFAGLCLCVLAAFLSLINTLLFALLPGIHHSIRKQIPTVLYRPEFSIVFCMFLMWGANCCIGLSMFFFFKLFDPRMIYVYIGLICFSGIGHGPVFAVIIGLYFAMRFEVRLHFGKDETDMC